MKKINLTLTAIFMFFLSIYAQNSERDKAESYLLKKHELNFTFQVEKDEDVKKFAKNMSVVNYNPENNTVTAWANVTQFRSFELLNIPYKVSTLENEVKELEIYDVRPLSSRSQNSTLTFPLSSYPTYAEYAKQMQTFENSYPNLVDKFSIGSTTQGDKELLFVKISDNVKEDEQEPKLMLTSSMHGDEIAGYPMMLTLIDYILSVYSNTAHPDYTRIKNLVENAEIWINPSANPDGTYHNSKNNTSVINARRGNANNVDLNRNYPDNVLGPHTDGEIYQAETLAFMDLAASTHFVISANLHSGTELFNYPFDNAYVKDYEHSDGNWFEFIGIEYATHAQTDANSGHTSIPSYVNKTSYMTDDDDSSVFASSGVTHGAEWYRVYGGRQDYMNFYHQCKEVTIELSDIKILPESQLIDYWYYNRDALLDFLTQGTYGFRGVVKDAITDEPIEAKVTLVNHDAYGSNTFSGSLYGDYYRPVKAGTYTIKFEAPNYQSITMVNQTILDYETKILKDVLMTPAAVVQSTYLTTSNEKVPSVNLDWTLASEEVIDK